MALALGFEPGALGGFTFEELLLAIEAASMRRRHRREERTALAAQAAHTLVYFLGLPHVGSKQKKAWANSIPSPQEMFEAWTGATGSAEDECSRANTSGDQKLRRPGFREGQPRTTQTILEDLVAWGVDPADPEAWNPRTQVELAVYFQAVEAKG